MNMIKIKKKQTVVHGKNGRIEQDKKNLSKLNIELEATLVTLRSTWSALLVERTLWSKNLNSSVTAGGLISLNKIPEFSAHNESLDKLMELSSKMEVGSPLGKHYACLFFTRNKFAMSWVSKEQEDLFGKQVEELSSTIRIASDERRTSKSQYFFDNHEWIIGTLVKELRNSIITDANLIAEGTKLLTDGDKESLENLTKLSNIAQLKLQSINEKIDEVNGHLSVITKILEQSKESIEQVNIIVGIDELESRFGNRIPVSNRALSQYSTGEVETKILEARRLSHTVSAYREIR